jgi:hypothetical protein
LIFIVNKKMKIILILVLIHISAALLCNERYLLNVNDSFICCDHYSVCENITFCRSFVNDTQTNCIMMEDCITRWILCYESCDNTSCVDLVGVDLYNIAIVSAVFGLAGIVIVIIVSVKTRCRCCKNHRSSMYLLN